MKKWWSTLEKSTGAPSLTTRWVLWVFPNLKFSIMLPDGFLRLCELEFSLNPNISPEWMMVGPQRSHTSRAQGAWEKKTNGDDAHSETVILQPISIYWKSNYSIKYTYVGSRIQNGQLFWHFYGICYLKIKLWILESQYKNCRDYYLTTNVYISPGRNIFKEISQPHLALLKRFS